jgi:hypothetical protein
MRESKSHGLLAVLKGLKIIMKVVQLRYFYDVSYGSPANPNGIPHSLHY